MAVDRYIVGWIGDHHLREVALQRRLVAGVGQGIAADQAVPPELPHIAGLADRRAVVESRQIVGRVIARRHRLAVKHQVDFTGREAGQLDVEIEIDQLPEMLSQQIDVPDRLLGQSVVGDHDRALLGGGETGDRQGRDLSSSEPRGRL
jgi:hypothetical protein